MYNLRIVNAKTGEIVWDNIQAEKITDVVKKYDLASKQCADFKLIEIPNNGKETKHDPSYNSIIPQEVYEIEDSN